MDFIERLFGLAPDGGDGSIEALLIGLVVLAIVAASWRRLRKRAPRTSVP